MVFYYSNIGKFFSHKRLSPGGLAKYIKLTII